MRPHAFIKSSQRKRLFNAKLVLPDREAHGSLSIEGGMITEVNVSAECDENELDLQGDYLIPGLVDLHSDHLERHYIPRSGVAWPPISAALAHDAQIIGSGITTVFDSISIAGVKNGIDRAAAAAPMIGGLSQASDEGLLRAVHFLHLRCEVTEREIVSRLVGFRAHPLLRLISVMDHSPGERQFRDLETWYARYRASTGLSDDELAIVHKDQVDARGGWADENRDKIAEFAASERKVLASHDDSISSHVFEGKRLGAIISEFPTTEEAAASARHLGLEVLMGAPNIVRGGSHVGNLSAIECSRLGLLTILASDYVPSSLLEGAFLLARICDGFDLPRAIKTVTLTPARAAGLTDRGALAVSQRADLVQVREVQGRPVIQRVWCAGRRVH